MKSKRLTAFAIITLFSIILVGCNADQLVSTGRALGNLRNAGAGHGGDAAVRSASESVAGFVEEIETCVSILAIRMVRESGQEAILGNVTFCPSEELEQKRDYLIRSTAENLVKASESASSDSGLRELLDTPYRDYDGVKKSYRSKTIEWRSYRNLADFYKVSDIFSALFQILFGTAVDVRWISSHTLPFPAQVSDVLLVMNKVLDMTKHSPILMMLLYGGGRAVGEGNGISLDLGFITRGMAAYVGDRKEPTVGDKIAVCLFYDMMNRIIESLDLYVQLHPEEKDDMGMCTYISLTPAWILEYCSDNLDGIMTDLEALAYIYSFAMDTSGLVEGLMY